MDIQLEGGEVLPPLGGLEVIHVPGHTPGSVCLYSKQSRLLIVGDALDTAQPGHLLPARLGEHGPALAIQSAQKLAGLDFDTICFGHGPPLTRDADALLKACLARHRKWPRAAVRQFAHRNVLEPVARPIVTRL